MWMNGSITTSSLVITLDLRMLTGFIVVLEIRQVSYCYMLSLDDLGRMISLLRKVKAYSVGRDAWVGSNDS